MLAYSTYAHETFPIGAHVTLTFFEYFSCVLAFLCPLLPSCSSCAFCHHAEQAIDQGHHCVLVVSGKTRH